MIKRTNNSLIQTVPAIQHRFVKSYLNGVFSSEFSKYSAAQILNINDSTAQDRKKEGEDQENKMAPIFQGN